MQEVVEVDGKKRMLILKLELGGLLGLMAFFDQLEDQSLNGGDSGLDVYFDEGNHAEE